jgi:predicted HTH domain antitoxin
MVMQITIEIPDDLVATLSAYGQDPARAALEAIAVEAYRQQRLSGYQLRTLLGISSRYELDGFLKERQVYDYTLEDFEKDLAAIRELRVKQKADSPA